MRAPPPVVMEIGPPAREPQSAEMRRFMRRDDFDSLFAYWWDNFMSTYLWNWDVRALREEMEASGAKVGHITVPGLGVIGGFVRHEGSCKE